MPDLANIFWNALAGGAGGVPVALVVWMLLSQKIEHLNDTQRDQKKESAECRRKRDAEEHSIYCSLSNHAERLSRIEGRMNGHAK